MKYRNFFLTAIVSVFFWACSQDSPTPIQPTTPVPEPEKKLKEFPNTLLDLTSGQRTVDEGYWKNALTEVWKGLKKRNVEPYSTGLIHRPKSETPGDAVSEGVGYGMLTALFANDQQTFNQIWDAGNKYMWSRCYYNWEVDNTGRVLGGGAATDAEEDITLALLFADKLVKSGKWADYSSATHGSYLQHAQKNDGLHVEYRTNHTQRHTRSWSRLGRRIICEPRILFSRLVQDFCTIRPRPQLDASRRS